jgi:hypothetical protein
MPSVNRKIEQERTRAKLESEFGGLDQAIDLCDIGAGGDGFNLTEFVKLIRNTDIVMAFHRNTAEWWLVKGKAALGKVIKSTVREFLSNGAIIVPNLETVELIEAAVYLMESGKWPDERGMSVFFAEKLVELSNRGERH